MNEMNINFTLLASFFCRVLQYVNMVYRTGSALEEVFSVNISAFMNKSDSFFETILAVTLVGGKTNGYISGWRNCAAHSASLRSPLRLQRHYLDLYPTILI